MLRNIDTRRLKLLAQTDKSVARTRREWEQGTMRYADDNLTLLWCCARDWDAMDYLRKEHSRNLRYKNGDQWSDTVPDPDHPAPDDPRRCADLPQRESAAQTQLYPAIYP